MLVATNADMPIPIREKNLPLIVKTDSMNRQVISFVVMGNSV
jgi:hypothetical protein